MRKTGSVRGILLIVWLLLFVYGIYRTWDRTIARNREGYPVVEIAMFVANYCIASAAAYFGTRWMRLR